MSTLNNPKLEALLAKARATVADYAAKEAARKAESDAKNAQLVANMPAASQGGPGSGAPVFKSFTGLNFHPVNTGMVYNEFQLQSIELAMRGKSFCMIGAAGTGKTTTTKEIIGQLVRLPQVGPFTDSTKYLQKGDPGIVIVSFTNKAVNNIKKQLPDKLKQHCMTLHKVLEFEPARDLEGKIIGFAPTKNRMSQLPWISCAIFEESSMIGTDLYQLWRQALPDGCEPQEIFLGDLNQLPPVFGPSILGFKLVELATVELLHVYRQALQSPIITLAHRIREGKSFTGTGEDKWMPDAAGNYIIDRGDDGRVEIRPWKKRLQEVQAVNTMGAVMLGYMDNGKYLPDEDIILCPFNVSFGTLALNALIADRLTKDRGAITVEVIARGKESYWAVGDKVLFDQMEAYIVDIATAPGYSGRFPREESVHLRRNGQYDDGKKHAHSERSDMDKLDDLENMKLGVPEKNSASHCITIEFTDSGQRRVISASGDVNKLILAYAITGHKSQGSEWRRVFVALHYTHNPALSREWMYTVITRARHDLIMFIDPGKEGTMDSLTRAARNPEIKGVTLAEKAEYFKGKAKEYQQLSNGN